jgi:hypothetical protein
MSYTVVKWRLSPRQRFGIPRAPGTFSRLPEKVLKDIPEDFYEVIEVEQPKKVKDTMAKKTYTRPVRREKDS